MIFPQDIFKLTLLNVCFSRTISLLGNRGTFFLLMVNPDREAVRKRLAISLHYVLYNEFFAAEGGGQSEILLKPWFKKVPQMLIFLQVPLKGRASFFSVSQGFRTSSSRAFR